MPHNHLTGAKKLLKQMLGTQYFAVLSSAEKGQPYSNLVAFAATEDLKRLVFTTNRNTRKYKNIAGNKSVSMLIDSRTNQSTDINTATAITAVGTAHEETEDKGSFRSTFLKKHPYLKEFVDNPDTVLIVISVSQYIIANFDSTQIVIS